MNEIIIPGMVGGLRKGSHNRMAYKAAREPMPEGAPLNRHEPRDIPIIDQDGRPTNEAPPAAHPQAAGGADSTYQDQSGWPRPGRLTFIQPKEDA